MAIAIAAIVALAVIASSLAVGEGGRGRFSSLASPDVEIVSSKEALSLREEVREAFVYTYDAYMRNAFPKDELLPLSCKGVDTLGSYALTLVDSVDTLAVMGNWTEFAKATRWIEENLKLSESQETVSLFETNIRVLGGLLSAHLLKEGFKDHAEEICGRARRQDAKGDLVKQCESGEMQRYDGELLAEALALGEKLALAFEDPKRQSNSTRTGIPYGSVNLATGVLLNETEIASTAGGGTLAVEFGVLSRLTGDPKFEDLARSSMTAIWERRSKLTGLVGAHINITSGIWTHLDSGVGASIDSYYEYLHKANVLLGLDDFGDMFRQAYHSVEDNVRVGPWYVEVNMENGVLVWPIFNALQAFWPGLQTLMASCSSDHQLFQSGSMKSKSEFSQMLNYQSIARQLGVLARKRTEVPEGHLVHESYGCENRSDVESHDLYKAIQTHGAMFAVWKRHGATPEGYSLSTVRPQVGQLAYALRPELIESTYYLYLATRDPSYLSVGRDMLAAIQTRCRADKPGCGYASLASVDKGRKRDHMESFFLAETLKYLYLLFDAGARDIGEPHRVVSDLPYEYVFSTEGHLFPLTKRLSDFGKPPAGNTEDVIEGYCRPLHPIWNTPRYKRHFLPDAATAEDGSLADPGKGEGGGQGAESQNSAMGVIDIQAFLIKSLMKLQSFFHLGGEAEGGDIAVEESECPLEDIANVLDAPAA
ncbi:glycoside hydrolase [Chloropicon primus]|uniref:alpha-1,2-Mannosidase n=1 Tax=Chloropicon primus TaxID=1764295 RepID=A0A5B8MQ52_9CHLO|nr:glycoside hydrolase [Chloropicon primus]UPR01362.1 glycoside hydrolase [Chloropicon primus]|eukprot:QDZ22144.1 glycoside hydrolase [Chloropicon primus]